MLPSIELWAKTNRDEDGYRQPLMTIPAITRS